MAGRDEAIRKLTSPIDLAWVHATAVGGPWEWRMRPSGAVAVVVPLGWQVIFQPQRWMTMMW
jgi:hypothetical protein